MNNKLESALTSLFSWMNDYNVPVSMRTYHINHPLPSDISIKYRQSVQKHHAENVANQKREKQIERMRESFIPVEIVD